MGNNSVVRVHLLPEPCGVDAAAAWDEGYCSYPGRPRRAVKDRYPLTPTEQVQQCAAKLRGVSRGHSTEKPGRGEQ